MPETIRLRVKRQDGPGTPPYWEEFEVPDHPGANVVSCLQEIARNPVTREGQATTTPAYNVACLEEVCGSCTMYVNGRVRQACSALVVELGREITLEPMAKFPVVRDLSVNRGAMFEALKKVRAWVSIDGTHDLGPGRRQDENVRRQGYDLSRCMTCGCCLEVCPQVNSRSSFVGAAAISQVALFNSHPTGRMEARRRLATLMDEGGIADCGNAQNCVRVCPKEIPLTAAIAAIGRQVTRESVRRLLGL